MRLYTITLASHVYIDRIRDDLCPRSELPPKSAPLVSLSASQSPSLSSLSSSCTAKYCVLLLRLSAPIASPSVWQYRCVEGWIASRHRACAIRDSAPFAFGLGSVYPLD